jgi:hypothetical protein
MESLRHYFFAGSVVSGNEYVGIAGTDAAYQGEQGLYDLGFGYEYGTVMGP